MKDSKTELISVRMTAEMREKLKEWRRKHPDLPDEPEAIRLLIEAATKNLSRRT
jgi:hypothetical protein